MRQHQAKLATILMSVGLFFAVTLAGAAFPATANAIPVVSDVTNAIGGAISSVGGGVLKDALQWLFGGLQAKLTAEVIKFLVHIDLPTSGSLSAVTGPIIVIGGFFLVVGLITSVGDGYREVIAGTDTAPRVIGQVVFRVVGLALLMGSWFWLVPLVVEVANHMSSYVLSDHAVHEALRRSFVAGAINSNFAPILWVLMLLGMAMVMITLVVLKFIMVILFACLYVGGPAAIGLGALPRIGPMLLGIALRALFTLMIIPLVWTIVFAAWAGVGAGTLEAFTHFQLLKILMGPGLFIAGVVVLLAITRRLFAMAVGGMRLSMPGAGMARAAITMAIGRALGAKMIDATSSSGGKGKGAAAAATQGAPGDLAHVQSEVARGIRPSSALETVPRRKLPTTPGDARAQQVTDREARQTEVGAATGDYYEHAGVKKGYRAPEGAVRKMREDTEQTATTWDGHAPVQRLHEAGKEMPAADRAGIAKMGAMAYRQHPEDPAARDRVFRHDVTAQYAGRDMLPERREAIVTAAAGGADNAMEAYGSDLAKFDQPLWASTPQGQTAPVTNTDGVNLKALKVDGQKEMIEEHNRAVRKTRENQQS